MIWTQEEIAFIQDNPKLSYLGVAVALGRTRASVRRKAERLRKEPHGPRKRRGAKPGEAHHLAKLTEELVLEMRREYAQDGVSMYDVWERHMDEVDVGLNAVSNALMRKTWRHI